MQAIRADKEARARGYHRALAECAQLPRLVRLLDLKLATSLAAMAVGSVTDGVLALHAAAPARLGQAEGGRSSEDAAQAGAGAEGSGGLPYPSNAEGVAPLLTQLVVAPSGTGTAFSPSEAEWLAALDADLVAASLDIAAAAQPLLSLPAFQHLRGALAGDGQQQPAGAAQLASGDPTLQAARDSLAAAVQRSFAQAEAVALQYQSYLVVHRFGQAWDFEAWAARQR